MMYSHVTTLCIYIFISAWLGRIMAWLGLVAQNYYDDWPHNIYLAWSHPPWPSSSSSSKTWPLLPILGTLLHRNAIPWRRYLLSECIVTLISLSFFPLITTDSSPLLFLILMLVFMSVLDIDHMIAPDYLTLPLAVTGSIMQYYHNQLGSAMLGIIMGYIILWIPMKLYQWIRRHPGMGLGDCKCFAAIGAWLGCAPLIYLLLLATVSGTLWALCMDKNTTKKHHAIPFIPFLCLATTLFIMSNIYPSLYDHIPLHWLHT